MLENDNKTTTKPTFGTYGKSFQEKIGQALLSDAKWAEQMMEVFDSSYFELKYLQFLADRYFAYSKKYKVFPTLQLLVTIIREDLKVGTDVILRDQIIDYLQRMKANPDPGDLQFVKDKSLDFCRKQALKAALEGAVDQMQAEKYESIVDSIRKAVLVGTAPALGHDFFADYESRFTRLQRNCVGTGLDELDRAGGHLVAGVPHDRVAERALAGAVGAHQGVHLAAADLQVHPLEDLLPFDRNVQILDDERVAGGHGKPGAGGRDQAWTFWWSYTSVSEATAGAT